MKYLLTITLAFIFVYGSTDELLAADFNLTLLQDTTVNQKDSVIIQKADVPEETEELEESEPVIVSVDTLKKDSTKQEAIVVKYYQAVDPPIVEEPQPVVEPEPEPAVVEEEPKKEEKKKGEIRTLTGSSHHGGGFFGLGVKMSEFQNKSLAMGGIRAAWIINRTLSFGVDAWGVIPSTEYTDIPNPNNYDLNLVGGYGGVFLEPILFSNQVIHLTFPVSSGAGWLGYIPNIYGDQSSDQLIDQDVFWYVEPGAAVELNISRNFRLNFAVSKRFTQDLDLIGAEDAGFDELNYTLSMKIGRF
ncbi:hypothetical protein [Reichenbachiella ulvae]|uniref:Outer membrane protein beta-barrel domain-containing protein n=1 Tax=Reichenbachiella ulvae TaxID=2980104 RepID=A0ABT3CT76_9BACT|nr:hypothetical protein [Reichenbachiella ulvae]MCV9386920.1 hypothetical protein [Reichenbachiella ulvae]